MRIDSSGEHQVRLRAATRRPDAQRPENGICRRPLALQLRELAGHDRCRHLLRVLRGDLARVKVARSAGHVLTKGWRHGEDRNLHAQPSGAAPYACPLRAHGAAHLYPEVRKFEVRSSGSHLPPRLISVNRLRIGQSFLTTSFGSFVEKTYCTSPRR